VLKLSKHSPPSYRGRVASIRYEVRVAAIFPGAADGGKLREVVVGGTFGVGVGAPGLSIGTDMHNPIRCVWKHLRRMWRWREGGGLAVLFFFFCF
jgi:hypothetical protein